MCTYSGKAGIGAAAPIQAQQPGRIAALQDHFRQLESIPSTLPSQQLVLAEPEPAVEYKAEDGPESGSIHVGPTGTVVVGSAHWIAIIDELAERKGSLQLDEETLTDSDARAAEHPHNAFQGGQTPKFSAAVSAKYRWSSYSCRYLQSPRWIVWSWHISTSLTRLQVSTLKQETVCDVNSLILE